MLCKKKCIIIIRVMYKGSCPIIEALLRWYHKLPEFIMIDHRGCIVVYCGSMIVANIHHNKPQYICHNHTTTMQPRWSIVVNYGNMWTRPLIIHIHVLSKNAVIWVYGVNNCITNMFCKYAFKMHVLKFCNKQAFHWQMLV
jgi:hypothetical protein